MSQHSYTPSVTRIDLPLCIK